MKCPNCGHKCAEGVKYCPKCKQPLITKAPKKKTAPKQKKKINKPRLIAIILCWIACLVALGFGAYKLVYWVEDYQINRLYTRGQYAPTINKVTMSDYRNGHALIFYGEDGDQIYIPELNRSLTISGGVARVEIADSDWFDGNTTGVEYADITLSPMLITEKGEKTRLPLLNFCIDVPESPIEISSPEEDYTQVVTSTYPITLQVVAGSTVYLNGEDITDQIDRSGALSLKVKVKPIGENVYTLLVRTPKHVETRKEIVLYREAYDINLELDTSVSTTSDARTMAITGLSEPGATISVDTDYVEESLNYDMETGRFSFIAKFSEIGTNTVRFRASKEGKEDAVINFQVYYLPSLAEYSATAWAMDYSQLKILFEQWRGKVFLCEGELVDLFREDEDTYLVMDVGDEEQQLIILQNLTTTKSPTLGRSYAIYADADGRKMYKANYYPLLIARYIDVSKSGN